MATLTKINDLKQGDIFSFDENGRQYTVHRKGTYKMLLNDGLDSLISFYYFIYLKPIFYHGYNPERIAKSNSNCRAETRQSEKANFKRFSNV